MHIILYQNIYSTHRHVFIFEFQANSDESYVPFMPNVLKVFLENGQTKSFKYDNKTTVKVSVWIFN